MAYSQAVRRKRAYYIKELAEKDSRNKLTRTVHRGQDFRLMSIPRKSLIESKAGKWEIQV